MSNLKLTGNASGTGTVTVQSPNTNSNFTATVPAATTDLAGLAVTQTFTGAQRGAVTTDNDGSFDLSAGNNFACTPSAGFTLTFTNMTAGQSGFILLVNNSNYAITAAATTKVATTMLATISATGTYLLSYYTNGTNTYVTNSTALA